MIELWRLSATSAAQRLQRGELKSVALVSACLERISALEPTVRAFVDLQGEQALAIAHRMDAQGPSSDRLLHGVPVGIKEIIDVQGMRCSWGTSIHRGRIASSDAAAVQRLKLAGAIVIGTLASTEYAIAAAAATTNPHDARRTPGGSSSGSAAAVASHMMPLALGTQSIGSIVRPSIYCGVFGLKPTRGAISTQGVMPLAPELDHVGPIARTVDDLVLAHRVLTGPGAEGTTSSIDGSESASSAMQLSEVLLVEGPLLYRVEPESRAAVEQAVGKLSAAGLRTKRIELSEDFDRVEWCAETLLCRGMFVAHAEDRRRHGSSMSERVRSLIDRGAWISDAEHLEAQQLVAKWTSFLACQVSSASVLVNAATVGVAPFREDGTGYPMPQALWTLLGWPALAVPCGAYDGMPIGVQLVALPGMEQQLFAAARTLKSLEID